MRRAYSVWSVLTAIGAAGCAVVMIGQIFSLKRGGPTDHAFVLAALVLMMALAARWRKVHGDIDFVMLAKNPTIDAWWKLLSREVK